MDEKEIKSLNRTLGARMKMLRTARHVTQEEFSNRSGYSKNYISAVERGINKPAAAMVLDYCRILDITPNEFFGYDNLSSVDPELLTLLKTMDHDQQQKLIQLIKLTGI